MPVYSAPAKINLYLHLTGKREDGYHLLDSMVVFANDIADQITIEEAEQFSFTASGNFAQVVPADNLVTRAVQTMAVHTGRAPHLKIHLEKNIPAGAGLGGGSADAAAVIKGLEDIWNITLGPEIRDKILLSLGADVPVCYHGKPCRFRGIGEIIEAVPCMPPLYALIVWPDCHSDTKEVFAKRTGSFGMPANIPASFDTGRDLVSFLKTARNDLAEAAEAVSPAIGNATNFMAAQQGCLLARMSGSGSAVFGLFEDMQACEKAKIAARTTYPAWFTAKTCL